MPWLDADVVKVQDVDKTIADPAEKQIDIRSNLVLEVGKSSFVENAVREDDLTETTVTSSTKANANLGALTYQAATTANIGDYMQLQLKDTSATVNQIFSTYS